MKRKQIFGDLPRSCYEVGQLQFMWNMHSYASNKWSIFLAEVGHQLQKKKEEIPYPQVGEVSFPIFRVVPPKLNFYVGSLVQLIFKK